MLLNDLMRQFNESVEQTGPRFTGYWKAKDPAPAGKKMVGSESAINELNKSPKNKFETMQYGNWTIDMSLDPIMMPKITGNTAMFVARATHKKDARGVLFGKGNSQAAARDDVLSQINDNLRSANPDDFTQFTIDLNVDFTKNYLDPKSGNYFKLQKDDAGQPVLVMASREYFANFGKEMEDLGFRKATSRIKITGNNSIPVYALAISKNAVKSLGLIPNMRYTLEEVGQDSDGNTMFSLKADTRTLGKHDKYRMGVPGLTLAASTLESTMEDSNPTDKITMDVPLFLRMMEYAKEDAKTDMDLHDVTERAIELMKQHDYLCMDNYSDLVGGEATGGEQPTNEAANENSLKDFLPPYSANGLWVSDRRGNSVLEVTRHGKVAQQVADALNQYSSTNEFKDTAQYGDDSGKNINHEIFQLLKSGATVYSNAAGRMGKVLRANNDGVVIASKRGKGFTSFNSGDPVKIKQDENKPNTYHIVNLMDEAKKKITAKNDPCWSGYHMVGTKKKNGREVPNCVPGKKGD